MEIIELSIQDKVLSLLCAVMKLYRLPIAEGEKSRNLVWSAFLIDKESVPTTIDSQMVHTSAGEEWEVINTELGIYCKKLSDNSYPFAILFKRIWDM